LTRTRSATHNRYVMYSPWRAAVALMAVPCLVFSSVVPPAHVHEADAHHPHSIIHRHFESHDHDHDGAEISHNDGRVIWLDYAALQIATCEFAIPQGIPAANFEMLPEPTRWLARSLDDAAPPHGPPRRSPSLRGPPCLSI